MQPLSRCRPERGRDTRPSFPEETPAGSHPQPPVRPADPGALGCSFVSGAPTTSRFLCRAGGGGSSLRQLPPPARPAGTQQPRERRKGQRAPHPDPRGQVSSWRGAAAVWGPGSSSWGAARGQVRARSPRAPCCGGGGGLLREIRASGESEGLRARRRAEQREPELGTRRRADGGVPWARGRGGSRETSLGGARGGAPGRSSPGAAGLGPGAAESPGAERGPRGREGAPLPGGVPAEGGRRSGGGRKARCGQVRTGARALHTGRPAVPSPGPACCVRFPGRPEAGSRKAGRSCARTPAFGAPSPTPSARRAVSRTGGHNSSEAAVTPGGSSCPCTSSRG